MNTPLEREVARAFSNDSASGSCNRHDDQCAIESIVRYLCLLYLFYSCYQWHRVTPDETLHSEALDPDGEWLREKCDTSRPDIISLIRDPQTQRYKFCSGNHSWACKFKATAWLGSPLVVLLCWDAKESRPGLRFCPNSCLAEKSPLSLAKGSSRARTNLSKRYANKWLTKRDGVADTPRTSS